MAIRLGDEALTSRRRPPTAPSTFTTIWATVGASFLAPRTSPGVHHRTRRLFRAPPEFDKRNTN